MQLTPDPLAGYDKIAPALVAAQDEMMLVGKSGRNTFDRYTYANLEDYYRVCREVFHKHGIAIIESVTEAVGCANRTSKKGEPQYVTRVKLELCLLHKSGQLISIQASGEGQDRADKSTYKAITGARKYAIAMAANLVTTDDIEKDDRPAANKDGRPNAASDVPAKRIVKNVENVIETEKVLI